MLFKNSSRKLCNCFCIRNFVEEFLNCILKNTGKFSSSFIVYSGAVLDLFTTTGLIKRVSGIFLHVVSDSRKFSFSEVRLSAEKEYRHMIATAVCSISIISTVR